MICATCKKDFSIGTVTCSAAPDAVFCSGQCCDADPRVQKAYAEARAAFGLFTCHDEDGQPYGPEHWCGR